MQSTRSKAASLWSTNVLSRAILATQLSLLTAPVVTYSKTISSCTKVSVTISAHLEPTTRVTNASPATSNVRHAPRSVQTGVRLAFLALTSRSLTETHALICVVSENGEKQTLLLKLNAKAESVANAKSATADASHAKVQLTPAEAATSTVKLELCTTSVAHASLIVQVATPKTLLLTTLSVFLAISTA